MKNRDLFRLAAGLQSVGELRGAKFAYAVAKNAHALQVEVGALQAAARPEPAFAAFDASRIELCIEHAQKDEDGSPRINGAGYVIDTALQPAFDLKIEALKVDHAEAVGRREEQLRDFEALLDEEAGLELHLVAEEHLPAEITAAQLTSIFDIVDDRGEVTA